MTLDFEWWSNYWRQLCEDPTFRRIGVPVICSPRPTHGGMKLMDHVAGFRGARAFAVIDEDIGGTDDRYPGEVPLRNVDPRAMLFGCSVIWSGDVEIDLLAVKRINLGGAHQ